jgi:TetR/AcrR family transcriptional regulator, regulator of cefoperazone and chloramphenicol sensitivity
MTEPAPLSPRQRILEAVVDCIERDGFNHLTTRRIAEQAGTNIASINYYFRTKDLLVEEALSMTLRHMMEDIHDLIVRPGMPFFETLEDILFYLIEGGLRFPGTILAHMYAMLVEKQYDIPVAKVMREVIDLLAERAVKDLPYTSKEAVRMALLQVFSSAFFIMLAPGFFPPVTPVDFNDPGTPRRLAHYQAQVFAKCMEILQTG